MVSMIELSKLLKVKGEGNCSYSQKNGSYDRIIKVVRKLRGKEIVVIAGDFNGHVGSNTENYEGQLGGNGYGIRNKEGGKIFVFYAAINIAVRRKLSKKRASHLVTYELGP